MRGGWGARGKGEMFGDEASDERGKGEWRAPGCDLEM